MASPLRGRPRSARRPTPTPIILIAIGTGADAGSNGGSGAIAVGNNSFAAGAGDVAVGDSARVDADQGSAFGNNAHVATGATHSTAVGADAFVDRNNEMVFGTKNDTYTTPGITSGFSKSRQTDGPLEVVTSDQSGHLATDGGSIFKALDEAKFWYRARHIDGKSGPRGGRKVRRCRQCWLLRERPGHIDRCRRRRGLQCLQPR